MNTPLQKPEITTEQSKKQSGPSHTPTVTLPNSPQKELFQKYASFIWEVAKVVGVSLAIIIPIRYYVIQPFYVKGASMEPTFYNYEYLIIDELSYRFHDPQRGDVVVLHNPNDESQYFIKRVIGLPGETVDIKNHHVQINGTPLNESSYLADTVQTWGNQHVVLGDNQYYVMGDNRGESLDSRVFGPVQKEEFIGRTWVRAWPFNRLAHFTTTHYQ